VFKKKFRPDGTIEKYKAMLVAKRITHKRRMKISLILISGDGCTVTDWPHSARVGFPGGVTGSSWRGFTF
jgi:hypothetical protein